MHRRLTALLLAMGLVAAACSSTITEPEAAPTTEAVTEAVADVEAPPGTNDDVLVIQPIDSDELRKAIEDWEGDADGGGIAFVRNEDWQSDVVAAGIDPATGDPLDVDDRVRVGSISKVITAVLVMQLVDKGLVELDAPVSTYVTGLALANDVSIAELLGHRSGIPNYTVTRGFFEVVMANPDRKPQPTDMIGFTNGESDFDPGSQFAYSNTNYVVAGLVIEAVRGQSLNDALEQHINGPLGLTHTTFADGTLTDVVGGYSAMTPTGNSYAQSYSAVANSAWAAGSLVTTVEELAMIFDALFFGDLVSADSRVAMVGGIEEGAEYGLGLHEGPDFGVGHGGSIVGFNSIAQIDLESRELVIAVVNNDQRSPSVLSAKLTNVIRR